MFLLSNIKSPWLKYSLYGVMAYFIYATVKKNNWTLLNNKSGVSAEFDLNAAAEYALAGLDIPKAYKPILKNSVKTIAGRFMTPMGIRKTNLRSYT